MTSTGKRLVAMSIKCNCFSGVVDEDMKTIHWEDCDVIKFADSPPKRVLRPLPIHRTEAGYPRCSTCDGGGCLDCTDPA